MPRYSCFQSFFFFLVKWSLAILFYTEKILGNYLLITKKISQVLDIISSIRWANAYASVTYFSVKHAGYYHQANCQDEY